MKIKVVDKNNEILAGVNVTLEIRNTLIELTSDEEGIIVVENAKEDDSIKYYASKDDVTELKFLKNSASTLAINAPLKNMMFFVADTDGEPVEEVNFVFRYLDKEIKKVSNEQGEIKLSNIPINTTVECMQVAENKDVISKQVYKCDNYRKRYELKLEKKHTHRNVKFVFTGVDNKPVNNISVRFKINGEEFDRKVKDSSVILENVKIGALIECKQIIEGLDLEWQKFKCKQGDEDMVFHCNEQVKQNVPSQPESKQTMKFRLVNSNSQPIANAVVKFEIDEKTRNKYTNLNGEVESDELEIGAKFNVSVDVKGRKLSNDFIFQGDEDVKQLVLKGNNGMYYILLGLLLALCVGVIIYATSDFAYDNIDKETQTIEQTKKDTVIIRNYQFKVENKITKKAINNSLVKLYYADTMLIANTNNEGEVNFTPLPNKLPTKYEISKLGFFPISKTGVIDSLVSETMTQDSTVFVNEKVLNCDKVAKANGAKTSYITHKMQIAKGSFKIWFNFFKTPCDIKVYSGGVDNVGEENLIFSSKKGIKGIYNSPYINFDKKAGLVTICITSSKKKSNWVYKVYCAKSRTPVLKPKKTTKPKPPKTTSNQNG